MSVSRKTQAAGFGILIALVAVPAAAQLMGQDPWTGTPTNRASIAFSLKSIEDGEGGSAGAAGGSVTSFLCGGGSSTASGNTSCVILNNATGSISSDQTADGSQSASVDNEETTNVASESDAEEIMQILNKE